MNAPRLGRYELVRKIAAGGMAEIFLARQWGAGGFFRDVVVKRLFKHLAEHPRQLRMFQDEGRLLAALSHPNIPQVYDLGFADGHWYIAMEYVEGWNVADVWRQGAKTQQAMPMSVAVGIVMQACEALHHAHERTDRAKRPLRIVHRDITPQNLMLTRDGVAKLMDFGVAQTTARKDTEAGAVRGTFSYMAPEQVRAKPLDKRADVFALGVILYELTTGSRLFRGTDVQIMTQVVEQDVPLPSTRVPDYPAELEEIVMAALLRDRGRRTPSTAHLAWKLDEFAQRYGLAVGPRAVARYVGQVIPAEPIQEDDLALVQAEQHAAYEIASPPEAVPEDAVDLDEDGLLGDLDLLSLPPEHGARGLEHAPQPISLPPDALLEDGLDDPLGGGFADLADVDGSELEARAPAPSDPPPADVDGLADLLAEEPLSSPPPQRVPRGVVPLPRQPRGIDLGASGDSERPVLLLNAPKKKSARPPAGPGSFDYVRELEKRLAGDDDEG